MRGSRKFCLTEGSTFDNVSVLVVESREDSNITISGPIVPPAKRQFVFFFFLLVVER